MAKTYQEIIAEALKKNSQKSKVVEQPKEKPKDEDYEDAFEDEEVTQSQEKAIEKPIVTKNTSHQENPTNKQADISSSEEEKISMQLEMLQNNGRYRAEMLFQMQELNKNLGVIAEILVNGKLN